MTKHEHQAWAARRIVLTERLSLPPAALRWRVHAFGAIALTAYATLAILSFMHAAALWRHEPAPRMQAYFEALGTQIHPYLPFASAWFAEGGPFDAVAPIIVTQWIVLAIISVVILSLLMSLLRRPDEAVSDISQQLLQWSYAFTGVCAVAFPVFTQDLWLSAVWGRMIVAGANPFHMLFTPEFMTGLPLDHFPMPMSYGPLWGLVSGGVMLVAGNSVMLTFLIFKGVLALAWIGALRLVFALTRSLPQNQRCIAILVVGWLPSGVSQSIAEGHNDVVMVSLALSWLFQLFRGRTEAPVALAASALCKYVTLPLFAVDAIHALRVDRIGLRSYALRLAAPVALIVAVMAIFMRSPAFFDGVRLLSTWYFLQPRDAIQAIELVLGVPLLPLVLTVNAFFPVFAVYTTWIAWYEPTTERLLQSSLATMSCILFATVSHLWPWYVIWVLPLAALLPCWWLSRFIIGVAIVAPFTLGFWWIEPFANHREVVAFAMYALAIAWTIISRPRPRALTVGAGERA